MNTSREVIVTQRHVERSPAGNGAAALDDWLQPCAARNARRRSPSSTLRENLRASLGDGFAFGAMVGFGETYLPAFALAVGLGELTAGLIASVPLLAGGVMQMVSPTAVRLLGSHKRWVICCATIQALAFVPFFLAALLGRLNGAAAMVVASLYWGAGLATGPAWNSWIDTLVPRVLRARFFALRTRASQGSTFAGFLAGGLALQVAAAAGYVLETFALLFALAACCRLTSAWFLAQQSEPVAIHRTMRRIPLLQLRTRLRDTSGGRLLVYLVAVQAAVQLSGAYFTPFLLGELGLGYGEFVTLLSVAFLCKILALPTWGRIAHVIGARRLLWVGAIGITPLSAAWLISQQFAWLLVVQAAGGITWAAYELAFFLLFFESIPQQERTGLLTVYNLLNTGAWVAGSLLGAAILCRLGTTYEAYLLLFGLSSLGRCLALALLARVSACDVQAGKLGVGTVAVRADAASIDAPVLPSMPDQYAPSRLPDLRAHPREAARQQHPHLPCP